MIITDLIIGKFVKRPNRFLVLFEIDHEIFEAHLKDPGRLNELLTPRVKLLLKRADNITKRKTKFDVIGVLHKNRWVIINSSLHSDLAADIIGSDFLRELKGYDIERREYSYGRSRIDFLLRKEKEQMLLEVKGCTLVEGGLALFPDAPTLRGKKHVLELTNALKESFKSTVLFLIMRDDAKIFKPNYKMDPEFSNALKIASDEGVKILAYSFKNILNRDMLKIEPFKPVKIRF